MGIGGFPYPVPMISCHQQKNGGVVSPGCALQRFFQLRLSFRFFGGSFGSCSSVYVERGGEALKGMVHLSNRVLGCPAS